MPVSQLPEVMTQVGMALDVDSAGDAPVLIVHGEVDMSTAPILGDGLRQLLGSGHQTVIVDLDDVGFLDSTGLGALVSARTEAVSAGGGLPLVCRHGRIRKLLVITGLDGLFDFYDSVDDARAAVAGAPSD
jgi:anti-sigma B factor antagonist